MRNTSDLRQLLIIAFAAGIGAIAGERAKPYLKKGFRSRR